MITDKKTKTGVMTPEDMEALQSKVRKIGLEEVNGFVMAAEIEKEDDDKTAISASFKGTNVNTVSVLQTVLDCLGLSPIDASLLLVKMSLSDRRRDQEHDEDCDCGHKHEKGMSVEDLKKL